MRAARSALVPAPVSLSQLADDVLVSAEVVARALGISVRQVSRLEGLPVVVISARVRRYRVGDVKEWIAGRVRSGRAA